MRTRTLALATLLATPAQAASLDGTALGWPWALPFAGLLLTIAAGPTLFSKIWHAHYGKIAALWAALALAPVTVIYGAAVAAEVLAHALLGEFLSFFVVLFVLSTVAGGIVVSGSLRGTPSVNTALLAFGTGIASIVGTTGAAMILIRPVISANARRRHRAHVIVFFIILVANVGGALTPLGDPPLFVGFLRGVDFFWTTTHLFPQTLFVAGMVFGLFLVIDAVLYHRETEFFRPLPDPTPDSRLRVVGLVNFALIGVVIAAILTSAAWKPGISFAVGGAVIELQNVVRDILFIAAAFASLALTAPADREANGFSWGPIQEVAKLFAGIFLCMVPVLAMLRAGPNGAFAPLVALVTNPDGSANNAAFFWLSGGLSSFLDNAPTYLVFFELAGGDPRTLMTAAAMTLAAISCGAVFMGANSYIGNAPNFMVYAIAKDEGVRMPSFFGYMLWSGVVLIPVFVLATFVFFR